ncbi:helix-turn-helix transcriptional regulator [Rhizobium tibeticum]|uniref:helix-turn-helix transcriptional regulator n=1 Tax=Rhizobium tibeticum TaxID=501024 RepID=UPI001FCD0B08|nr:AraC family transcriptional regulator [Rhizobium tibeticum]
MRADLVRRTGLKRQEIEVSADKHSIFLNIQGTATAGENYLDGSRIGFVARPEGSLAYVPPGRTWSGWDEGDSTASYLLISVERQFARNLFDEFGRAERLKPELGFNDLAIQFAARKIAGELSQSDRASGLIVEGHLTTIFGLMLRRSNGPQKGTRGGLAPVVLRRITERIEDLLSEKLTLTELSQEFGMSATHLCRAFKQSTGASPHSYLNSRRLERASFLLRTTSHSITEIALMCGYSSGSHFSTSFRQELGAPPAVYRAAWSQ